VHNLALIHTLNLRSRQKAELSTFPHFWRSKLHTLLTQWGHISTLKREKVVLLRTEIDNVDNFVILHQSRLYVVKPSWKSNLQMGKTKKKKKWAPFSPRFHSLNNDNRI
jgi:hypothetical protein